MDELPKLNYSFESLEPYIDAKTMEIHYTKHHQNYVNKLNEAIEKHPELEGIKAEDLLINLDTIPQDIQTAVKNNGGGHVNHKLFWESLSAKGSSQYENSQISVVIEKKFGSLEAFKKEFTNTALSRFGSGWAWLVLDKDNELKIYSTANQDSPLSIGDTPILTLDVWEHAYYLKYQNRRQEYIENWWNIVNWENVSRLYTENS